MRTVVPRPKEPAEYVYPENVVGTRWFGVSSKDFPHAKGLIAYDRRECIWKITLVSESQAAPYTIQVLDPRCNMTILSNYLRECLINGWNVYEFDSYKELHDWLAPGKGE